MNKFCTSLEQSKKLMELGIDINTADMMWEYNPDKDTYWNKPTIIPIDSYIFINDIPAWSLSALLKILPLPTIEETMITTTETKWKCTIYCESYAKYWSELHNDAIDAAFEMIVWLKENGKI